MKELQTLSIIWGVYGVFQLLVAILSGVLLAAMGVLPILAEDRDALAISGLFVGMGVGLGVLLMFVSVPTLIGVYGLRGGKKWGAYIIGVISILLLMSFPIGTILGGFTLYTFSKSEVWGALT